MSLLPNPADTIVAPATAPGEAALGILRLSGPAALPIVSKLWQGKNLALVPSHTLHLGRLLQPDGSLLDEVVAAVYRAPASYTREDVVELTCHGSPYILARALALLVQAGARLATPGEFTLRAFLHGALDLSQAEAVADLVAARSAQGTQLALAQLRGGFKDRLGSLRDKLLHFAALLELELDFAEEDVAFADRDALLSPVQEALAELAQLVSSFTAGNALKQGIPVALVGKPNAGKSTLLNRLLQENRAIVSPIPGTTRDVIEERLLMGGYEFRLLDTAGIRATIDAVEAEGVLRTLQKVAEARIVCLLYDAATATPADVAVQVAALPLAPDTTLVLLANKVDRASPQALTEGALAISALTGQGVEALQEKMVSIATRLATADTLVTSQRHVTALQGAANSLLEVKEGLLAGRSGELLAVDVRHSLQAMGEITGEFTSDEVLGAIFSRFCIGK